MNVAPDLANRPRDEALRDRAAAVIPGGMWGHQRAAAVPEGYPQFFTGGKGCRITDVNGRTYIDFMCSWGPNILGHQHAAVNAAAFAQIEAGDCLNGPTRTRWNSPNASSTPSRMPTGRSSRRTERTRRPPA